MENEETPDSPTPEAAGSPEPAAPASIPTPPPAPTAPAAPAADGGATPPPNTVPGGGNYKGLSILGYLCPVFFFLPLVTDAKNDQAARFHATQQLTLLIWYVVANIVGIVPLLGWVVGPLMFVFGVIVAIMGVINAAQGQQKELPLIGRYRLMH